ncbi:MAG: AAA family ATPase [Bacteroidota bacterium]
MIDQLYKPLHSNGHSFEPLRHKVGLVSESAIDKSLLVKKRMENLPSPRSARQRMKDAAKMPEIRKLCGPIWLSGELHILFADTGVGKSIMAVSIADALTKGEDFLGLKNETDPLTVLLYDFELSDKQAEKRYSDELSLEQYEFDEKFYYDTIDFIRLDEVDPDGNIDELLFEKIRVDLESTQADVLMIDNVSYLHQFTTQKTEAALNLMRRLNKIKREFGISVLVLAHTPKVNPSEPITINHLAGSKHLSNFADSVSAIGRSRQDKNVRFWKQVKPSRSAEIKFHSENVITCMLGKVDLKFLTYTLIGYGPEAEHLSKNEDETRNEQKLLAKQLRDEGKTLKEIAIEVLGNPGSKGTISKWLKDDD